ncbi:MAG: aldo/keto reductase [Gammaproteobacteria bacterium]|jgi:diketogulonate reductase-like aldo/keto reductase|nr:aldo/keto reductase [Gammaproteobacteria bacterium]MBT5217190.1 aldo/keto reductase [Gammaproteobacteria bacterium]MBT5541623.1 aldo/keto reductase [Gammaproteobacteria bacterium]MBT6074858.1 aldo/keto reductase [Gammaproteobacteria bacterium]MBT7753192.1 aldo/keto reductase [Gammaproteobacteria bacterium]
MSLSKRDLLRFLGLSSIATSINFTSLLSRELMVKRMIPSSQELLPVIGLGTSRVFDVEPKEALLGIRKKILEILIMNGGSMIDTSPMYGMAEEITGIITKELNINNEFFFATKVWTNGDAEGKKQISSSFKKINTAKIDLIQIHNLKDWKTHIKTLRELKDEGKIKYIGITHYKASAFDAMENIIKKESIDFAQFNYSLGEREAENRLLPLCQDMNIATIINRPFMRGKLFKEVKNKALPDWSRDFNINSWAQYFLKFILANPAVTNIIPATSKPKNMIDNVMGGYSPIPEKRLQERMMEIN